MELKRPVKTKMQNENYRKMRFLIFPKYYIFGIIKKKKKPYTTDLTLK